MLVKRWPSRCRTYPNGPNTSAQLASVTGLNLTRAAFITFPAPLHFGGRTGSWSLPSTRSGRLMGQPLLRCSVGCGGSCSPLFPVLANTRQPGSRAGTADVERQPGSEARFRALTISGPRWCCCPARWTLVYANHAARTACLPDPLQVPAIHLQVFDESSGRTIQSFSDTGGCATYHELRGAFYAAFLVNSSLSSISGGQSEPACVAPTSPTANSTRSRIPAIRSLTDCTTARIRRRLDIAIERSIPLSRGSAAVLRPRPFKIINDTSCHMLRPAAVPSCRTAGKSPGERNLARLGATNSHPLEPATVSARLIRRSHAPGDDASSSARTLTYAVSVSGLSA